MKAKTLIGNVNPCPRLHFCSQCYLNLQLIDPWQKSLSTTPQITAMIWEADSSTALSFTETSTAVPSFAETSAAGLSIADPIAHSSMAETSDTSMPSFDDISLPSFSVPSVPVEDSTADSLPINATSHEPPELEYHLIPGASKFGKDILTDSRGFSYTMKQMKGTALGVTNWRCTKCNPPKVNCTATVWQEGNIFIPGKSHHTCTAKAGITNTLLIKKEIESTALKNIFTPAVEITNKVLQENITNEPVPSLPAQVNSVRAANRYRQCFQPNDPVNLDFEIFICQRVSSARISLLVINIISCLLQTT